MKNFVNEINNLVMKIYLFNNIYRILYYKIIIKEYLKYNKLMKFESQKNRWYFQKDLLKSFHSNFQSYKKGIKYTEKFRLIQLYKI